MTTLILTTLLTLTTPTPTNCETTPDNSWENQHTTRTIQLHNLTTLDLIHQNTGGWYPQGLLTKKCEQPPTIQTICQHNNPNLQNRNPNPPKPRIQWKPQPQGHTHLHITWTKPIEDNGLIDWGDCYDPGPWIYQLKIDNKTTQTGFLTRNTPPTLQWSPPPNQPTPKTWSLLITRWATLEPTQHSHSLPTRPWGTQNLPKTNRHSRTTTTTTTTTPTPPTELTPTPPTTTTTPPPPIQQQIIQFGKEHKLFTLTMGALTLTALTLIILIRRDNHKY